MNSLKILAITLMLSLLTACSNTPTVLENNTTLDKSTAQTAHVVNIRQIKLDADWKHNLTGAALGLAVGDVLGDDSLATAGLFIGGDIANEMYGRTVDEVTIKDKHGNQYTALVPEHAFTYQQTVYFTHIDGSLTAISH